MRREAPDREPRLPARRRRTRSLPPACGIATWNVNSLKARLPRVEEFLGYADVDVLCLQETKLSDKAFPALTFSALGYESVHNGQGQWNGVAILSRVGIANVTNGFDDAHVDPYEGDARIIAADCGGVRFVDACTCPNGREVGTEFYDRKLVWLQTLHDWLAATHTPDDPLVVLGDFNVAPDRPRRVGPEEVRRRDARDRRRNATPSCALEKWGMEDLFRRVYPDADRLYSYWDYRARRLPPAPRHAHRPRCSGPDPVADRVTWAVVDRNARKGTGPSDHAPVIVDLAD